MACPVCDGTASTTVNVRMPKDSDIQELVGSAMGGQNVSRCDDCGVIYDPAIADDDAAPTTAAADANDDGSGRVNCTECGGLTPATSDECATCGATLD